MTQTTTSLRASIAQEVGSSTMELIDQLVRESIKEKEKHNGWTNYATWRVNLELVSDIAERMSEDAKDKEDGVRYDDIIDLADAIRDQVSTILEDGIDTGTHMFLLGYVNAFLDEVN